MQWHSGWRERLEESGGQRLAAMMRCVAMCCTTARTRSLQHARGVHIGREAGYSAIHGDGSATRKRLCASSIRAPDLPTVSAIEKIPNK